MPTGAELRSEIAKILRLRTTDYGDDFPADPEVNSAFHNAAQRDGKNVKDYVCAAESLAAAMPLALSIDNYLEAHQNNPQKILVGKIAIAKAILDAESQSLLRSNDEWTDEINFEKVKDTWFARFMQAATEGVSPGDLDHIFQDVSIVNFNYDRCLEYMVKRSLQIYFDLSEDDAIRLARSLYVFHPYGSVGQLPWQANGTGVAFGAQKRGARLIEIARSIKTFSERVDEGAELQQMRLRIANAQQIVCLGFAYHRQNLQLMDSQTTFDQKEVFGTCFGISKSDQGVVSSQLKEYLALDSSKVSVTLAPLKCSKLLDEYWRSITAS